MIARVPREEHILDRKDSNAFVFCLKMDMLATATPMNVSIQEQKAPKHQIKRDSSSGHPYEVIRILWNMPPD